MVASTMDLQGLDQDAPNVAFRSLAERLRPRLDGAVGLLLLADQVAHVLGVAADGRARAVLALGPDAGCDLVDGGAVRDGLIHGLAEFGRQALDGGAAERPGRCALGGFVLHGVAMLSGCFLTHPAMLPAPPHPVHRTMVRGPGPRSGPERATARRAIGPKAKRTEFAPGV